MNWKFDEQMLKDNPKVNRNLLVSWRMAGVILEVSFLPVLVSHPKAHPKNSESCEVLIHGRDDFQSL